MTRNTPLSAASVLLLLVAAPVQADPWWEDEQAGAATLFGLPGDAPGNVLLVWSHPANGYLAGFGGTIDADGDPCVPGGCDPHSPYVSGYEIHRSDDGGATFEVVATLDSYDRWPYWMTPQGVLPTEQWYLDRFLSPTQSYVYRVRLLVEPGVNEPGAFSNDVTVTPDGGVAGSLPCHVVGGLECAFLDAQAIHRARAACRDAVEDLPTVDADLQDYSAYMCGEVFGPGPLPRPF